MGTHEKLTQKILSGASDANIKFTDICNLLVKFGFKMKVRSSHHIFRKEGIIEKVNLQKDGVNAKSYQVKAARKIILKYKLGDK